MTLNLVPFATDPAEAVALAEEALRARLAPGEDLRDLWPPVAASIRSARASGGVLRSRGESQGLVLWEPAGPLGVSVRLLYFTPRYADAESYRLALELTERAAGPIAFAPGPLAGLSEEEESAVLGERGFLLFHRSEMSFPSGADVPSLALPARAEVRAVQPEDEPALARLHERAYRDHLDRFLGLEDVDPVRDADRQLRDCFGGRYGDLLTPGSVIVTVDGTPVSAVIAVRRPRHVLLVDVMTDPARQSRGFARAALSAALRDLRERGETEIVLNVTEENAPAVHLYTSIGFVRTLGPSKEWYDGRRMRVEFPRPAGR